MHTFDRLFFSFLRQFFFFQVCNVGSHIACANRKMLNTITRNANAHTHRKRYSAVKCFVCTQTRACTVAACECTQFMKHMCRRCVVSRYVYITVAVCMRVCVAARVWVAELKWNITHMHTKLHTHSHAHTRMHTLWARREEEKKIIIIICQRGDFVLAVILRNANVFAFIFEF